MADKETREETARYRRQAREDRQDRAQASQRRRRAAGRVAAAPGQIVRSTTTRRRYGAKHMLTAELLAGIIIVVIRAVGDYEVQGDGTLKGKIGHPKGQYGPMPILAGLLVSFFLLSFLAASGGTKAKVAVIFGGLMVLVLALKSAGEIENVAGTFGQFGKVSASPNVSKKGKGSNPSSPGSPPGYIVT